MMKKKRMHLKYESVKNKGEIKALYRKAGGVDGSRILSRMFPACLFRTL